MRALWWCAGVLVAACGFDAAGAGGSDSPDSDASISSADATGAAPDADPNAPDADPNAPDADPSQPDAAPGKPDGAIAACHTSADYVPRSSTGIRYRAVATPTSWTNAQNACAADGAHLVVINDSGEDAHVDSLLVGVETWIGLSDQADEGTFVWITGAPVVYTNWRPDGNPNDGDGTEPQDCAEIDETGGQWNDDNCPELDPYVCECPPP